MMIHCYFQFKFFIKFNKYEERIYFFLNLEIILPDAHDAFKLSSFFNSRSKEKGIYS